MNDITNLLSSIKLAPHHKSKPSSIATMVGISQPSYKSHASHKDVALDAFDTVEEKENTLDNELGLTFPNLAAEPGTTEQEESTKWKLKPRKLVKKPIIKQAEPSPPPADEPGSNFLFGNVYTPVPVQLNREHFHSPPALFRASFNEDSAIPMPFLCLTPKEMTQGGDVGYPLPKRITLKIRPGIGRPSLPRDDCL